MSSSNFKAKGDEYMKKGDKKAKGSFFGNIFKGKEERAESAMENYKNAATQYKLAQAWELAGEAFIRCVDCDKAVQGGEAGDFYVEAAGMYKKAKNPDYLQYLDKAVELFCSDNRISQGARLKKQIAENYESDLQYDLACKAYQEAADLFYAENDHTSDYFNMRLKVADLAIHKTDPNFIECIKIYDEVADKWLKNNLTAPSAKKLFFSAILLYLVIDDAVGAQNAMEKYENNCPSFSGTRQQKFLFALIQCYETGNIEEFSNQCYEHNKIIPLDKWQTHILSKIKEQIKPQGGILENNNQSTPQQQQQEIQQGQQGQVTTQQPDIF